MARTANDWQQTFDATDSAIWILDRDQRIVRSNGSAERYFHRPCDQMIGRHCWEIVHGTAEPICDCPALRAIRTMKREATELQMDDGWFEVIVDPFHDADGHYAGAVHSVRDITERKQAEGEHERLTAQLAQARRTEAIGRLAGGVAHDFNNMLQAILCSSELMLEELPPESPLRTGLNEILDATHRSADLTRQLLAFARRQAIAPRVLDLNAEIGSMLKMLRRLIGEDIRLSWQPAFELWPVRMDPSQIDQIVANLAVNARDAIAGVGSMVIETANAVIDAEQCSRHAEMTPGEYAVLTVTDDGAGMSDEVREHLFEPFYSTKQPGHGTGLGLATVHGIVHQNGGFIGVYSEPGMGATMRIYLPRASSDAVKAEAERTDRAVSRGSGVILLVEDEEILLHLATRVLEGIGYAVLAAGTPEAAIGLAEGHPGSIDLLVTDLVLPEMNGHELADRISGLRPGIRRMFMSGYSADVVARRGMLSQGVSFLQKPFSIADFAAKVAEALAGSD